MPKLPGMLNVLACLGMVSAGLGAEIRPVNAQLLYPPVSEQRAISVTGQGRASVPADQAQINVFLFNQDPSSDYLPPEIALPEDSAAAPPAPEPITQTDLQDVSDALVDLGIAESDIQINVSTGRGSAYVYRRSGASITLNIRQPTQSQINGIVQTISDVLGSQTPQKAFISDIYVQYAIDSCAVIEQQAYAAAMQDARLRALAIADAINVALVDPPSVAELPFLGRFLSPCNEETDLIGALFWSPESSYYNPEAPAEVEVYREVLVTYPVEAE